MQLLRRLGMNIRKYGILFLSVVCVSMVMASIIPLKVFAGGSPNEKQQGYPTMPVKKERKTKTPTTVPPTSTFTTTLVPTSTFTPTFTATKIPTSTPTSTLAKVSVPTTPPPPPGPNPKPCCPGGAIFLAGYAFFAVKNYRTKKTVL
jgi:hypothetical protein